MPHTVTWIDRLRIEHAVWAVAFRLPHQKSQRANSWPEPSDPEGTRPVYLAWKTPIPTRIQNSTDSDSAARRPRFGRGLDSGDRTRQV